MNKSDVIADLAAALSKAQGAMQSAKRDSANPFFKSTYADLASVWEACRKPLADNGLSVTQLLTQEGAAQTLETVLFHASGQWLSSTLTLIPKDTTPQAIGSVITYARRYALSAIVGVATEDDDAESASGRHQPSTDQHDIDKRRAVYESRTKKTVAPAGPSSPAGDLSHSGQAVSSAAGGREPAAGPASSEPGQPTPSTSELSSATAPRTQNMPTPSSPAEAAPAFDRQACWMACQETMTARKLAATLTDEVVIAWFASRKITMHVNQLAQPICPDPDQLSDEVLTQFRQAVATPKTK